MASATTLGKNNGENRLIYLLKARLPTEKAHGYQALKTCEAWQNGGLDVEIWAPARVNTLELERIGVKEYYSLDSEVTIRRFFVLDIMNMWDGWLPQKIAVIKKRLAAQMIGVTYTLGVALYLFKESENAVFYTRDHNLAGHLMSIYPKLARRLFVEVHTLSSTKSRKRRQARILGKCAGVVAMTEAMRSEMLEYGLPEGKVIVAHDGVDLKKVPLDMSKQQARKLLGLPHDQQIAMFVGKYHTLGREKGIPEILEAIGHLQSDFPNLSCYCVGGPLDREPSYRQKMTRYGTDQDRVSFVEKRPVDEVPIWLKAADILLMPHPYSEFYAYYVSPLKLFEYMASGRPIVASNLPSTREILSDEESALLASPGDPGDIAAQIRRLMKNATLAKKLGHRAKKRAIHYTWSARAEKILDFVAERRAQ